MISDIRLEMPQLKLPISLIVDDSTPGTERYGNFVEEFGNLVSETGIKGKFTLMPYPCSVGIDQALKGFMPERLDKLIDTINAKVVPNFDITPEILTHNQVVNVADIGNGDFVYPAVSEQEWSKSQDIETLTRYIACALQILKNVGLEANGVTSPGDFGRGNEDNYARAVLEAEKLVNGISLTWYFLDTDYVSPSVSPRLAYLDRQKREAVVSIISGCADHIDETREGQQEDPQWTSKLADKYIAKDGSKGRLAELCASDSYMVFHTHWWRLHRRGNKGGMKVLREVCDRLKRSYGDRIIWMKCSQIARYFAVQNTVEIYTECHGDGQSLHFQSPFACKDFTVSFRADGKITQMTLSGHGPLPKVKARDGENLKKNSWHSKDGKVNLCFDLESGVDVVVQTRQLVKI